MNKKEKSEAIQFLIDNVLDYEFKAEPNSWEWVKGVREMLLTDTEKYPWRDSCEELWSEVSYFQLDDKTGFKREDTPTDNPLESLDLSIEASRYPPLEVLITISDAFKLYLAAEGKLSLEEVFFGPEKKGVGNYSARKARSEVFEKFEQYITFDNFSGNNGEFVDSPKDKSQEGYAELFLAHNKDPFLARKLGNDPNFDNTIEPESFLRSYKRWVRAGRKY